MTAAETIKGLLDSPHGRTASDVPTALDVSVVTALSEEEAGRRLQRPFSFSLWITPEKPQNAGHLETNELG
jgi:hypothetical protein